MKNIENNGLNNLLNSNNEAKEFFLKLPENVQGMLYENTFKINSLDDLYESVQSIYN